MNTPADNDYTSELERDYAKLDLKYNKLMAEYAALRLESTFPKESRPESIQKSIEEYKAVATSYTNLLLQNFQYRT